MSYGEFAVLIGSVGAALVAGIRIGEKSGRKEAFDQVAREMKRRIREQERSR